MADGWVCLHRELLEKPIWANSSPEHRCVLVALLVMANHEPRQWEWQGKKFMVQRGQLVTSLESLAQKAGPGVSIQNVRTALARFEKLDFLTNQSTNTGRLITICNYSKYQDTKSQPNKADNKDLTKTQQRPNKDLTTNNNDNNDNNETKRERARPFPPDFAVTEDMRHWFSGKGYTVDIEASTERWKNAMMAKGETFKDWTAAWRNGMTKAQEWADEKKPKIPLTKEHIAKLVSIAEKSDGGVHVTECQGKIITVTANGRISGWS